MLPLFALVWFYGRDFMTRFNVKNSHFALVFEILLILWLVVMPGNYAVIRDGVTLLPVCIAALLFILTASATQKLKNINVQMPVFWGKRWVRWSAWLIVIALVGLSGAPTLWGFLLQVAALLCGVIIGSRTKFKISPTVIILAVTTLILMQPEFFRFGQLGNLTLVHKLFILGIGVLSAAIFALRNIHPRERIHHSAFIKLKWAGRIVVVLAGVLFFLTESVPVFLGLMVAIFGLFALSVWHTKNISANLSEKLSAVLLCAFGIVTGLPVITALGILSFGGMPRDAKFLL